MGASCAATPLLAALLRATASARAERTHPTQSDTTAAALTSLYTSESDKGVKGQIIQALFLQGSAKPLIDIARKETDRDLKTQIVKYLSMMHSKDATDFMMELLNK